MGNQILCCKRKWSPLVDYDDKSWLDDHLPNYGYQNLAATCDIRSTESHNAHKHLYVSSKSGDCTANAPWYVPGTTAITTQHISEREPENFAIDPSINACKTTIFTSNIKTGNSTPVLKLSELPTSTCNQSVDLKRWSSCGTVYIGSGCLFQPDREATLQSVTVAIALLLRSPKKHPDVESISEYGRSSQYSPGAQNSNRCRIYDEVYALFDERKYFVMQTSPSNLCESVNKDNSAAKQIYEFIKILFRTTLFGPECAVVALILLERLVIAAEVDIFPWSWRRQVLACVLVASKVLDDQAVWNMDYCNILRGTSVADLNSLERHLLALLQFNIDVPPSVYARYFFDLLTLGDIVGITSESAGRRRLTPELAQQFQLMPQCPPGEGVAASAFTVSTGDEGVRRATCGIFDLPCTPKQQAVRRSSMLDLHLSSSSQSDRPPGGRLSESPDRKSNPTSKSASNTGKPAALSTGNRNMVTCPQEWQSLSLIPDYLDESDVSYDPLIVDEETVLINSSQVNSFPFPTAANGTDRSSPAAMHLTTQNPHYSFYRNYYKPKVCRVAAGSGHRLDGCGVGSSATSTANAVGTLAAAPDPPMNQVIRAVMGGGRTVTYSLLRDAGLF